MKLLRQWWIWVFVIGILLFTAALLAVQAGNSRFLPAVIIFGAAIVPATVVTFVSGYEHKLDKDLHRTITAGSVIWAFIAGGVIGAVIASVLEFAALRTLGIPQLFGVGLIEEAAKLIFPLIIFFGGRYRSEADGILFGVASGMGFATLETIGYAFTTFLQSHGNVGVVEQLLLVRGIFSPAGHATWTALVCAVLWRERNKVGHPTFNLAVLGVFILAIVLHAGKALTQRQLLEKVWGPDNIDKSHMLQVNISNLRAKIETEPSHPRLIVTEPGVGYRLRTN